MNDDTLTSHEPGGLLAALVPAGVLRQPEVALTTGIWWVLGLDGAAGALDHLISREGPAPQPGGHWLTEVVGPGGRSDLEYRWGTPAHTHVVVEAKIGHTLVAEQLIGYGERLPDTGGLLVVLAPAARRSEALDVVARCEGRVGHGVRFDVWTFDEVVEALSRALPGSGDVAQLAGLVRAHGATDVAPFAPEDLLDSSDARRDDVWWVVDRASFGIDGSRLPSGADWSLEQRRYLPSGRFSVAVAVGVGRKDRGGPHPQPWAWLRVSGSGGYDRIAHRVLSQLRPETVSSGVESWLPLEIEAGVHGSVAAERLRAHLESLLADLALAIETEVQRELDGRHELDPVFAEPVLGMGALDPSDLLAGSSRRADDVWLLLTEAARPLYPERLYPRLTNDPDYELVRYLPVRASDAHVATCLGPRGADPSVALAWLRVHEATAHADVGHRVLAEMDPEGLVQDPHGWAIPAAIPDGADGPTMLAAIHAQLEDLVSRFGRAIVEG